MHGKYLLWSLSVMQGRPKSIELEKNNVKYKTKGRNLKKKV